MTATIEKRVQQSGVFEEAALSARLWKESSFLCTVILITHLWLIQVKDEAHIAYPRGRHVLAAQRISLPLRSTRRRPSQNRAHAEHRDQRHPELLEIEKSTRDRHFDF